MLTTPSVPNPVVAVGKARFGNALPLALIAGPCALEGRGHALEMASGLKEIAAMDIDRIEADRDYMRLHVGSRRYLLNQTITRLEQRLDPARFLRVHRSHIVRQDQVLRLSHNGFGAWTTRSGVPRCHPGVKTGGGGASEIAPAGAPARTQSPINRIWPALSRSSPVNSP